MRLCKDCKYSQPLSDGKYNAFTSCIHPEVMTINLVSGEKEGQSALMVRSDDRCGTDGKKWEEKS